MGNVDTHTDLDGEKKAEAQELIGENRKEILEALFGDKGAVIRDLKEHHLKKEEDVEMMGYKGRRIHVDLPVVGNFKGFKFDCFVSDDEVMRQDFEKNPEFAKKSYSTKDAGEILSAMSKYLEAMGVKTDGYNDYERALWNPHKVYDCIAGDIREYFTDLSWSYWLRDEDKGIIIWDCYDECEFLSGAYHNSMAQLLLKLHD